VNIPKTVKIAGYDYTIVEKPYLLRDDNQYGYQNGNDLEIALDSSCHQQMRESAFLHEILEAINAHNGLKMEHNVIETLETQLYQVLRDNKLHF